MIGEAIHFRDLYNGDDFLFSGERFIKLNNRIAESYVSAGRYKFQPLEQCFQASASTSSPPSDTFDPPPLI